MNALSLNRLKQIAVFCQVIDNGTMRAAAKYLNMTPSAVSQQLSLLEKELGVTLIYRSTRRLSLSEAGERYYQHGKEMLLAAEDANDAISEIKNSLDGELRISAPVGLASLPLAQALKGLILKNPGLQLTILANDYNIDLVSERIDIAIRVGAPTQSNFIYHHLGNVTKHIYASPMYLQKTGKPLIPSDLAKHSWLGLIGHNSFSSIELMHHIEDNYYYEPSYKMHFNNLHSLVCHVQEGLGIAILPDLEVQHLVDSGKLITLLPDWILDNHPLYALTIDRKQSYKVKAILKELKEFLVIKKPL